jgi:hypothetical protein
MNGRSRGTGRRKVGRKEGRRGEGEGEGEAATGFMFLSLCFLLDA